MDIKDLSCGVVKLKNSGCIEDFISILLVNGYTVALTKSDNEKIEIKIFESEQ